MVLALVGVLLAGCGPASPPPYAINVTAEQIAQAQRTWQDKKLAEGDAGRPRRDATA